MKAGETSKIKKVVEAALIIVNDLFNNEGGGIRNIGLEEVSPGEDGHWDITIGFSRPFDSLEPSTTVGFALGLDKRQKLPRVFKVVTIHPDTLDIKSIENRND